MSVIYWVHSDSYTMVRYLKRLKSSRLGRVQAFPMYGGLGMSAPSLYRESTDSLILGPKDNSVAVTMCVVIVSPFALHLASYQVCGYKNSSRTRENQTLIATRISKFLTMCKTTINVNMRLPHNSLRKSLKIQII